MNKSQRQLIHILEKQLADEPFSVDGYLQKWVVLGKAQNGDEELLRLLLASPPLKEAFFKQIASDGEGALVFDSRSFVKFLEMKNYLKDSYTAYKNKIGLMADDQYLKPSGEVVLAWPFKDCILEGGQSHEDDKRNEVFFNQTLARDEITQLLSPKVFTAGVCYTAQSTPPPPPPPRI